MAGFVLVLVAVSAVVALLFRQTENKLRTEYRRLVQRSVESAVHRLDTFIREIYNISDNYAFNNQLDSYLEKEYTEEQVYQRRADVMRMYRNIFETSDILQKREKISGILTAKGVLFNFADVNCDGQEVADRLTALGVNGCILSGNPPMSAPIFSAFRRKTCMRSTARTLWRQRGRSMCWTSMETCSLPAMTSV